MDTRLKKYRYSGWVKLAASVLCIAGLLLTAYGCLKAEHFEAVVEGQEYRDSASVSRSLEMLYHDVYRAAFDYKSAEKIQAGDGISEEQLMDETNRLSDERRQEIQEVSFQYEEWLEVARTAGNTAEVNRLEKERNQRIDQVNIVYDQKTESIKESQINQRLQDYFALKKEIEGRKGLCYAVLFPDGTALKNIPETKNPDSFFMNLPVYASVSSEETSWPGALRNFREVPSDGSIVYVGMTQEQFDHEQKAFEASKEYGRIGIYQVMAGLMIFFGGVVYLIYAAGRRPDSDEVVLIWTDRIYLDIELALALSIIGGLMAAVYQLGENLYTRNLEMLYVFATSIIALAAVVGIAAGTSVVKRLKRREFWKRTFVGVLFIWVFGHPRKMWTKLREQLKTGPLAVRAAVLFAAYAVAMMIGVLMLVGGFLGLLLGGLVIAGVNIAALLFVLKKVSAVNAITAGTECIRAGKLSHRIPMSGEPVTDHLAENINMIAEGLNAAVENEVKAERLKAELVTNVSHDLKTPLTSIITYVDLLKTEGVCSENAPRYLEVLDQKSQRLKALTEDLFEAAKASSGNVAYTLEKLDITDLITQGLGELSDKVAASGLDFKINSPKEKVYVLGDGKLLWRVIENLLSNVFKYALPNSRVYLETGRLGETVVITLKNISALPLNIHPDELMERFKRGDESRSSEGSGLGLSIAKSLTELQGGTFGITIDGDLFKAEIAMPVCYE